MRFGQRCTTPRSRLFSTKTSPGRIASKRLYRVLQRQCKDLMDTLPSNPLGETMFLIQPTLNPSEHGKHRCLPVKTLSQEDSVRNLLEFFRDWNEDNGEEDAHAWFQNIELEPSDMDSDTTEEPTLWATASSVQEAIRYTFRHARTDEEDPAQRRLMNKFAIRAVTVLLEQAEMRRLSSISYDNDVRVVATSRHIGVSQGGPLGGGGRKNRFNYRMRIENLSDQDTIQLLGRFWHIEDLGIPKNRGPAGENPIIVDAPKNGAGRPSGCDSECQSSHSSN